MLFCYTLGKAQRVLAELARHTDRPVLVHGMMLSAIDAYREAGVAMLPVRAATERPRGTSFAGELVLAPLSARGTPWMRRLGDVSDAFASGLMRVRGVRRQRAYDRGFVLSDHADWPDLLRTVEETGASTGPGHARPRGRVCARAARNADSRAASSAPRGKANRRLGATGRPDRFMKRFAAALRRDRPDDVDQRQGRRDGGLFRRRAARGRRVGRVLPDRPAAEAPGPVRGDPRLGAGGDRISSPGSSSECYSVVGDGAETVALVLDQLPSAPR